VPPRAVGNDGVLQERALWIADARGARLSEWKRGRLSVYGLCEDCNNLTSARADPAYADFHDQVTRLRRSMRHLLVDHNGLPARLFPGLVARSVLAGMFAINDRLQEHYPDLA
jgi:hypothetical protein